MLDFGRESFPPRTGVRPRPAATVPTPGRGLTRSGFERYHDGSAGVPSTSMPGEAMVARDAREPAPDTGAMTVASGEGAELAAVSRTIHDAICWALTKDRPLQESTMAHDDDLAIFWTDSDTTVFGWERYVKLFDIWMDPRWKATLTEVRDLRPHLSRSGDVAWFTATLDDLSEWDGAPMGARDIRWTGVLEKRDGRWVFVQMHGSVAADRAAVRSA